MSTFVNASITVDPTAILDNGLDAVNTNLAANGFPNWSPSDANLAVIIMGVVSQWAADNANTAATVSAAIFRAFGTQLCGIPYIQGAYAGVSSTWTFSSPAPTGGYTVSAGTQVDIDGSGFYVQNTVVTSTGATNATVQLVSTLQGAAYNGLGGVNVPVEPVDQIDWVTSIITAGFTNGGSDQESDTDYQNRLASVLQLQAPRPITASDYAAMVLSLLCQEQTGIAVGRATAIDGWYPAPRALTTGGAGSTVLYGTLVSGTSAVTIISGLGANQVPQIGAALTAASGIASGTAVSQIPAPTPNGFTMSIAATASVTENITVAGLSGYGPANLTGTGSVVSGSTAVTGVTGPYVGSIAAVGATVTATGVPTGDTVAASPAPTTTTFSLVSGATATHAAETITLNEWNTIARCVTVFVTDVNGNALSVANMDALGVWLQGFREANFLVFVEPPSTTTIYVTAQIHVLPGYASSAAITQVQNALLSYLSPATWGNPSGAAISSSTWLNYTQGYSVVRFNSIIGVIESVQGVQYAVNGQVFIGATASPAGTSDITLSGPAPLVTADITTPTIVITAV